MPRLDLIRFRRGTAAEWAAADPVLADGEPGWEKDTTRLKVGDGVTAWSALPFVGSQSTSLWRYRADTTAQSGNPGIHDMRWNNATQISATELILSHITNDGIDIDLYLEHLGVGDRLIVQDENLSDNFQHWTISGAPTLVVDTNNYWLIPVTFVDSGGTGTTGFANNHDLFVAVI